MQETTSMQGVAVTNLLEYLESEAQRRVGLTLDELRARAESGHLDEPSEVADLIALSDEYFAEG